MIDSDYVDQFLARIVNLLGLNERDPDTLYFISQCHTNSYSISCKTSYIIHIPLNYTEIFSLLYLIHEVIQPAMN